MIIGKCIIIDNIIVGKYSINYTCFKKLSAEQYIYGEAMLNEFKNIKYTVVPYFQL